MFADGLCRVSLLASLLSTSCVIKRKCKKPEAGFYFEVVTARIFKLFNQLLSDSVTCSD